MENKFLLKDQKILGDNISQLFINIKKLPKERRTKEILEKKLEELEKYWENYNGNDDELRKEPDLSHYYFKDEEYNKIADIYTAAVSVINGFMANVPENGETNNFNTGEKISDNVIIKSVESDKKIIDDNVEHNREIKNIEKLFYFRIKEFKKCINLCEISINDNQSKYHYENSIKKLCKLDDEFREMLENLILISDESYENQINIMVDILDEVRQKSSHVINLMQKAQEDEDKVQVIRKNQKAPKLEPISIPKFNGRFKEWIGFKNLFLNIIHENITLSNVEKLQYLKNYLEGEPLKMINHLQIINENYNIAFQLITNRYENTRKLVDTYLDIIFEHPMTSSKSPTSIKLFHDNIKECLEGLKALDVTIESPMIIYLGLKKLDAESIKAFEENLNNPKELPTIEKFMSFLESRYLIIESINDRKPSNNNNRFAIKSNFVSASKKICFYCQSENHRIYNCDKFNKLSTKDKNIFVIKKYLCKNCLSHKLNSKCSSTYSCAQCGRKHHTILHYNSQLKSEQSKSNAKLSSSNGNKHSSESLETTKAIVAVNSVFQCPVLLSTALVFIRSRCGRYEPFRALIDQGSQVSLISEKAAQLLGLPREIAGIQVTCLGANNPKFARHRINIEIQSHFTKNTPLNVTTYILPALTGNLPNETIHDDLNRWNNIILADPHYNTPGSIDVLLGADVYGSILMKGIKKGHPTAIQTSLGWILCGPICCTNSTPSVSIAQTNMSIIDIQDAMMRFWTIEEVDSEKSCNNDQMLRKIKIQRQNNGRYSMQLPFKNDEPMLGNSRNQAVARFIHLEKSLNSHPTRKLEYHNFIKEYLDLGHMKPVINANPNQGYYLPHHAVWKKDSITTKLRVVFDASAKTSNGRSLNDELMVGPTIQENLTSILTRWRSYKFVFTADIEKMYRQIDIAENDHVYQKILWRFSMLEPVQEYYLTTVTYGTASAPYLATRALQQLADDESPKGSLINKIIKKDFYVDDLMSGANSEEEGKNIITTLIKTLSKGGFNLRKWSSNNPSLIAHLPKNLKLDSLIEIDSNNSIKTLGIWWNSSTDEFTYKIKANKFTQKTKRAFLSDISKIFDPMGWIAPITIVAKILMQELWTLKLNWDDELPQFFQTRWEKLRHDLMFLEEIKIPRYLHTSQNCVLEIHGFCDASEKAYAAVVYARIKNSDGYNITLLGAKTRVAPLSKEQSIPRLELCGALLLANYMNEIKKVFQINESTTTYYWTDSTISLAWIKGEVHRWKSFVAHRVAEINKLTTNDQWFHVGTKENSADLASRGIKPIQLIHNNLWWHGPSWLKENIVFSHENKFTTLEEVKNKNTKFLEVHNVQIKSSDYSDIITRFSTFTKLIRVISYVRRFKTKYRGNISTQEFNETTEVLVKYVQGNNFVNEIKILKGGERKNLPNKLLQLHPYIDNIGIIRVGGRLANLQIKSIAKNPIILPGSNHFTILIIRHAHMQTLHGGNQLTLAYIREKYWIPNGKCLVRKVIHNCVRCTRFRAQTSKQIMGNLPVERINPTPPFTNTGLDYAGPIHIRLSRGRGTKSYKGFIVIFVCLATRAIHLEVVSDLTSNAFLAAFDRFTARRGYCLNIYSDNGTTFVGADKILKKEFQTFIKQSSEFVADKYSGKTNWHFIPPGAPHFGGIWEAAVKSMKHHLKRVIGDQMLTFEEFTTVLCRIEACLNSRPLSPLSSDPTDLEALTPGHFLIGRSLTASPECDVKNINCHSRWQLLTQMVQHFWNLWSMQYLSGLQQRRKWFTKEQNLNPGDLVLIKEDNIPPTKWIMGRINQIHPGTDGLVRVVTLKLPQNKFLKRPVTKICPFPIQNMDNGHDTNNELQKKEHNVQVNFLDTTREKRRFIAKPSYDFSIVTTILLLLFFMRNISAIYQRFNIQNFTHQPGIYFEECGKMRFQRNEWNLIIHYNLTQYKDIINEIQDTLEHFKETCHISDNMCNAIFVEFKYLMFNIKTSNVIIQNSNRKSQREYISRHKRGLINGIGIIANELFGVLDSRSASKYEEEFAKINENQNRLIELARNHTSITDATVRLFSENTVAIQEQLRFLNDSIKLQKKQYIYTGIALKLIITMIRIQDLQARILNVILDTHNGIFNPILLPPDHLASELRFIKEYIPADVIIPDIINGNLADIYNMMTVKTRVTQNHIIFSVKIPLPDIEMLDIFKLIPLPISYKNESLIIIPSSEYLIINMHKDNYYPLNSNELNQCFQTSDNTRICKPNNPVYNIKSNRSKCEVDLINHKENYFQMCTMQVHSKSSKWIQLMKTNSWIYSMDEEYPVDFVCDSRIINSTKLKGQGIVSLGSGCILMQNDVTIAARNVITTNVQQNFFPLVNSEKIFEMKDKHDIQGLQISESEIRNKFSLLQKRIADQQDAENNFYAHRNNINENHLHHYILIYFIIIINISFAVYYIIRRRNKVATRKQRADIAESCV